MGFEMTIQKRRQSALPPDKPTHCKQCGGWPATLHEPDGTRLCETCAKR